MFVKVACSSLHRNVDSAADEMLLEFMSISEME